MKIRLYSLLVILSFCLGNTAYAAQPPLVPQANMPTGGACQSDQDCLIGCPTTPINGSRAPSCIAFNEGDRACLSTQPAPIGGLVCKCLASQHLCGFTLPE